MGAAKQNGLVPNDLERPPGAGISGTTFAAAIAMYTAGPLTILLLADVALWGSAIAIWMTRDRALIHEEVLILVGMSVLIAFVAIVSTIGRTGQWLARVQHGGLTSGIVGAGWLLGLWLWGAVVYGIALPWCIGFLWLVIDSLRG